MTILEMLGGIIIFNLNILLAEIILRLVGLQMDIGQELLMIELH
jgi:hypothetical protein